MTPPPEPMYTASPRPMPRWPLWLAMAISAIIVAWAHREAFLSPYVINDDVRQQVAWMQMWRDPALFQHDLLTDFGKQYVSYGVRWLYAAADVVVDPILFSKVLAGLLYTALAGAVFAMGWQVAGAGTAWALCCIYWIIPFFLHNISGGLARAFAGPLMALFCWGWMTRRGWAIAVALALQALCIPYIFGLCALAVGVGWVAGKCRLFQSPPFLHRGWHWAVLLLGGFLGWHFTHALDVAGYGPLIDRAGMAGREIFTAAGRLHIVPVPSVVQEAVLGPVEKLLPTRELGAFGGAVVTVLLGAVLAWGAWRAPWRTLRPFVPLLVSLGAASVLLYVAARLLVMQLFVPTRYLEYSVALGHTLLLGMCLAGLFRSGEGLRRWAPWCIGVFALAGALRLDGQALYDYSRDVALYDAVQQAVPKEAMVAGHPFLMDNVLTFGQRKVLVSFELAHPWCVGLWEQLSPRMRGFFDAYYAADAATVHAFAKQFQVDWMVVDSRHFEERFLHWPEQDVPACEAGKFGPFKPVCEMVTNATVRIKDPLPDVYPVTPPFFEPYRSGIRQAARQEVTHVLLDETRFPGTRVNEFIRLVPLRGAGQ